MSNQREGEPIPLTAIHIDLQQRSITLEADHQPAVRLILSPRGILYELLTAPTEVTTPASPISEGAVEQLMAAPEHKEQTIIVTGRLKSKPIEGKRDSKGRSTAWARLAVHQEGSEGPKLYSATFHRHTAKIALGPPKDAQVTVQGYAHPVGIRPANRWTRCRWSTW